MSRRSAFFREPPVLDYEALADRLFTEYGVCLDAETIALVREVLSEMEAGR